MKYLELARSASRLTDATGQTTILRPEALPEELRTGAEPGGPPAVLETIPAEGRGRRVRMSWRWRGLLDRLRDRFEEMSEPWFERIWALVRRHWSNAVLALGGAAVVLLTAYIVFVQN